MAVIEIEHLNVRMCYTMYKQISRFYDKILGGRRKEESSKNKPGVEGFLGALLYALPEIQETPSHFQRCYPGDRGFYVGFLF